MYENIFLKIKEGNPLRNLLDCLDAICSMSECSTWVYVLGIFLITKNSLGKWANFIYLFFYFSMIWNENLISFFLLLFSFWKTKCPGMNQSKEGNLEVFDEVVCEHRLGESITDCNEGRKITSNSWWISNSNCFQLLRIYQRRIVMITSH